MEREIIDSIPSMPWFSIATILALIIIAPSCFYIVRGKTAAILETFGKPHRRAALPGLRFKLPWPITSIVARVNLQLQEIDANVAVKTADNAFMTLPVKVQYRASDEPVGAVRAHYELENPAAQIASYVLNTVRQAASGMEMIELYANRDKIEQGVQDALREQFVDFGYVIANVLVDEPQPSKEVQAAFNTVIASKRLMEAAGNEAEAARIKLVGAARAEAESKKLQGEGMAQMREAIAKGLKEAMTTMTDSGLTTEQAIALLDNTNRLDTITTSAAHGNLVIVDTHSVGAIPEMIAAVKAGTTKLRPVASA